MQVPLDELDAALTSILGMTWAEICTEHDMKCGRCKRGTLRVATVTITDHFPGLWEVQRDDKHARTWHWPAPPTQTVTVDLRCEDCAMAFAMPLHAKEET